MRRGSSADPGNYTTSINNNEDSYATYETVSPVTVNNGSKPQVQPRNQTILNSQAKQVASAHNDINVGNNSLTNGGYSEPLEPGEFNRNATLRRDSQFNNSNNTHQKVNVSDGKYEDPNYITYLTRSNGENLDGTKEAPRKVQSTLRKNTTMDVDHVYEEIQNNKDKETDTTAPRPVNGMENSQHSSAGPNLQRLLKQREQKQSRKPEEKLAQTGPRTSVQNLLLNSGNNSRTI